MRQIHAQEMSSKLRVIAEQSTEPDYARTDNEALMIVAKGQLTMKMLPGF